MYQVIVYHLHYQILCLIASHRTQWAVVYGAIELVLLFVGVLPPGVEGTWRPALTARAEEAGVEDVVELVEQLDAEGASWNDFMGRYGEAGLAEGDDDVDPFHVRLDELIKLLFHMRTKAAQKQKVAAKAAAEGE